MLRSTCSLFSSLLVAIAVMAVTPVCIAQTTTVMYDAGEGPAADPLTFSQWSIQTIGGSNPNGMPSTTTDGNPAWMFGDPAAGGDQGVSLAYDFTQDQVFGMSNFGFTLDVEVESLASGGFLSFGYNGMNFNEVGPDRSGFTPGNSGGVTETFTWSFDPQEDDTVVNSTGSAIANTGEFWSGDYARLHLSDNSTFSDALSLKLVSAVLTIEEDQGALDLTINRDTGEISLGNSSGDTLQDIIGYSILSDSGSLDPAGWDQQAVGASQLANDNDQWTVLSDSGVTTDLSESVLETTGDADGGDLTAFTGEWSFGDVWSKSPFEDVVIELLVDDGTEEGLLLSSAASEFRVTYEGDSIDPADLDTNGVVDTVDWIKFKAGYGSDVTEMTQLDAYLEGGDINLDGVSNIDDFLAYRDLYAAATSEVLELNTASVPEPASWLMVVFGGVLVAGVRKAVKVRELLLALALVCVCCVPSTCEALTLTLYDADPDNNPATPAPDPTTMDWAIENLNDFTPAATVSNPGTTSGSAPAWILDDAGSVGAGPNQNNILYYNLDPFTVDQMDSGGYTLTMEFEQLSSGGFVGIGYNHNGSDDDIGLTGDTRYGQTPTAGPQAFTYSWNGSTFTPNPGALGPAFFSETWGGSTPGGGRIFFADNSSNSVAQHLAITKVTLDGPDINPLEPGVTVDLASGEVILHGDDVTDLDVTSYTLSSSLGQLVSGNLSSLESQHIGDPAMDPDNGIGLEVLSATDHDITEGALTGSTLFDNSTSLSLGNIFNTSTAEIDRDLNISFTTLTGTIEGVVQYIPGSPVLGDYNGDGTVNSADYAVWRDNLGSSVALPNEDPAATTPGVVDAEDFQYWKSRFGATSGSAALQGATVPEPSSFIILLMACLGLSRRTLRICRDVPGVFVVPFVLVVAWAGMGSPALATIHNERAYLLGDNGDEPASPGEDVGYLTSGVTYDSAGSSGAGNLQDLFVVGSPDYVGVSDRPGVSAATIGAAFNGSSDLLHTDISMNAPDQMWDNGNFFTGPPSGVIFPHNYEGLFSHGIQLWAKPGQATLGTSTQTLVHDTAEHGIGIAANGNWELLYDKVRVDTETSVGDTLNEDGWVHVMELSGFSDRFGGGSALGGALLVNGVAVAVQNSFYDPASSPLVIGAQPDGEGYTNHYDGTLDDVRLFLWGDNSDELGEDGLPGGTNSTTALNADGQPWGTINLGTDNDWIVNRLEEMEVTSTGDVDLSGGDPNSADVTAFLSYWRKEHLVDGVRIGDWNSRQEGDLNYDGIVDLRDAKLLNAGLQAAGAGGLDFGLLYGGTSVPEPATCVLGCLGAVAVICFRKSRA